MTRIERIRNKSHELGKRYFPDANNVWARANIEAQYVSNACMEIAQWADRTMLDKAVRWLEENIDLYAMDTISAKSGYHQIVLTREFEEAFRQAMEGGAE